jgi:serine/threonine protein kinase/ankyrin repeat protein
MFENTEYTIITANLPRGSPQSDAECMELADFYRAEVNEVGALGNTRLIVAASSGHFGCIQALIEMGADVAATNHQSWTSLMVAAANGYLQIVEALVRSNASANTVTTSDGFSALLFAVEHGQTEVAEFLVANGADVNTPELNNQATALMIAAERGNMDVVMLLLRAGADINHAAPTGFNALLLAMEQNEIETAMALLQNGANAEAATVDGATVIGFAAGHGSFALTEMLLERGVAVNSQSADGVTPLFLASENGQTDIVALLLKSGADPNLAELDGYSPLMVAAQNCEAHDRGLETLQLLISNGAAIDAISGGGVSALDLALRSDALECANALLENGAPHNLPIENDEGGADQERCEGGEGGGDVADENHPIRLALPVLLLVGFVISFLLLRYRQYGLQPPIRRERRKKGHTKMQPKELHQTRGAGTKGAKKEGTKAGAKKAAKNSEAKREKGESKRMADVETETGKQEKSRKDITIQRAASEVGRRGEEEKLAREKRQMEQKQKQAAAAARAKEVMETQRLVAEARQAEDARKKHEELRKIEARQQAVANSKEKASKQAALQEEAAERLENESKEMARLATAAAPSSSSSSSSTSTSSSTLCVGSLTVNTASLLGKGSCGTNVYKGVHADGRDVAVKVMLKEVVPEHRARREMKLLQDLAESTGRGRDHVIQYRCIEQTDNKVLLGMELCECSLHDVVSVWQQQIPLEQQLRVVRELSEAVAFLHEHQIVHRDVRPKNILFKQGGFEGTVKLTDFGLSKEVDTRDLDVSFSTTTIGAGTEIGSFGYYAPEVYRRENPTAKIDIFSLGCCIFYVFSHGRRPFEDPEDTQNKYLLNANVVIGRSNFLPIRHLPEAVPLVASMIDIEAKVRPDTAQVLEHPLFWNDEMRWKFLCAVGKDDDIVSNSAAARAVLPFSLLTKHKSWADALDQRLWLHYTKGKHARSYTTASTVHLLRFLRNCEAHPPAQDSLAQVVLVAHGGMASYFRSCFPKLALVVWTALVADETWATRNGLSKYMQYKRGNPHQSLPLVQLPVGAGELEQWLASIHPSFTTYTAALTDYGYEDLSFVRKVDEADFDAALKLVGMAKPAHRAMALKRFRELM